MTSEGGPYGETRDLQLAQPISGQWTEHLGLSTLLRGDSFPTAGFHIFLYEAIE
jgi:hypothetical protein